MKQIKFLAFALFAVAITNAQVGIGTTNPDASAVLELKTSDKGLLIPRLTTTEITAITSPAEGLIVYNVTEKCIQVNVGDAITRDFKCLGAGAGGTTNTSTAVAAAYARFNTCLNNITTNSSLSFEVADSDEPRFSDSFDDWNSDSSSSSTIKRGYFIGQNLVSMEDARDGNRNTLPYLNEIGQTGGGISNSPYVLLGNSYTTVFSSNRQVFAVAADVSAIEKLNIATQAAEARPVIAGSTRNYTYGGWKAVYTDKSWGDSESTHRTFMHISMVKESLIPAGEFFTMRSIITPGDDDDYVSEAYWTQPGTVQTLYIFGLSFGGSARQYNSVDMNPIIESIVDRCMRAL